jgi:hypothetical protein
MAHQLTTRHPTGHRFSPSPEWLSVLEMLILGPLAAILVLEIIPSAFVVEWSCSTALAVEHTAGADYVAAFAVFGSLGWFAVLTATIFAGIADARRVAAILPAAWFVLLVGVALIVAAAISPAACPV